MENNARRPFVIIPALSTSSNAEAVTSHSDVLLIWSFPSCCPGMIHVDFGCYGFHSMYVSFFLSCLREHALRSIAMTCGRHSPSTCLLPLARILRPNHNHRSPMLLDRLPVFKRSPQRGMERHTLCSREHHKSELWSLRRIGKTAGIWKGFSSRSPGSHPIANLASIFEDLSVRSPHDNLGLSLNLFGAA